MDDLLTPRETEVAHWLHEGKSCASVGTILGISRRTAEKHCERIYEKLGVSNRVEFLHRWVELCAVVEE